MSKVNRNIIILFFLLVSGCATTKNYDKALDLFVGLPLGHLESTWGKPQDIFRQSDGKTVVEYRTYRIMNEYVRKPYLPQYSGNGFIPPDAYIQTPDLFKKVLWCRTRFIINDNGIVESWNHEGNDCKK